MTTAINTTATHRARLYTLLSVAFDRPGEPLERALDDGAIPDGILDSVHLLEDDELAAAANELAAAVDATAEPFRTAYGGTFGVEGGSDISPYETEYRPGGLVTNTDELADIAGFYDAFGLEVGEQRDRVDHLCTELEFVGELAAREAYLEEVDDLQGVDIVVEAQRMFLEDHLGRWVPRLRTELEEEADGAIYPALARVLDALVSFDADRLGAEPNELVAEPSGPLENLFDDESDGDWRCDTCVGNPSANNPMKGNPR